jgi:hypothetical protein
MPLDRETAEIMTEQGRLHELVASDGWPVLKERMKRYLEQFNINNIDIESSSPEEVVNNIRLAKMVISIFDMFVSDIEGDSTRFEHNRKLMADEENGMIINNE